MHTHSLSMACSVPVFRYALERWDRDLYQVIVVKDGAFTEQEIALAQSLKAQTKLGEGFLNAQVSIADLSDPSMRETLLGMYPQAVESVQAEMPMLTLFFPREQDQKNLIWQAPFDMVAIEQLQRAASNIEITDALLAGASTVFAFVECGDATVDQAAFDTLRSAAAKLQTTLEIPEGIIGTNGEVTGGRLTPQQARAEDPSNQLKSGIPLRIQLEVIRLTDHPIVRSVLLHMEDGLHEQTKQPMAFPIFGRARVLPPMVGDAINEENITLAANYLCGACSCQMKAQNPGTDSLSDLDWRSYLDGSEIVQVRDLPPLSGILAETVELSEATLSMQEPNLAAASSTLRRNALIVGGVLLIGLVAASKGVTRTPY